MSWERKKHKNNFKITMLRPKKTAWDIEPQQLVGEILYIYIMYVCMYVCMYVYIYISQYIQLTYWTAHPSTRWANDHLT